MLAPAASSLPQPAPAPAPAPPPPPAVVTTQDLSARFRDFDDEAVYKDVMAKSLGQDALNFVVEFGADSARVALDLQPEEFAALMRQKRYSLDRRASAGFRETLGEDLDAAPVETPIRWINIWNPSVQGKSIQCIGERYGFSSRLILSICAWDLMKQKGRGQGDERKKKDAAPDSAPATGSSSAGTSDLEKGINGGRVRVVPAPSPKPREDDNVATFRLMQDSMNYTSIDVEKDFMCVGANWLHKRPQRRHPRRSHKRQSLVPPNHWSWFALCNDHTVLSFNEGAYFEKVPRGEDPEVWRREELQNMRSNTLKVLRQLSRCGMAENSSIMELISVRKPLMQQQQRRGQTAAVPAEHHAREGSSNLFYYLFEDYSAAVDILIRSKVDLDDLRDRVLDSPEWKHRDTSQIIPDLYALSKDLRQLQHLFTNYKTLIERLLNDGRSSGGGGGGGDGFLPAENDFSMLSSTESVAVLAAAAQSRLSNKARHRFHRLQDQLQSLMLDTIQDYLDEKESLQSTYFNLTNQKDSQATARLTRSATLLAKLSVFFLPISFMTSYFSVQIPDLLDGYTANTYWGAFGVVAGLSFLSLFFFSKVLVFVSDRLDGLSERALGWVARRTGRGERKAHEDEDD